MLYKFMLNYVDIFSFLNVFKYLTVRTGLAIFTSLFVVFLIGTPFINFFSTKQIENIQIMKVNSFELCEENMFNENKIIFLNLFIIHAIIDVITYYVVVAVVFFFGV